MARYGGRWRVAALLMGLIGLAGFAVAQPSDAVENVSFTEKLSRTPRFIHAGPFVGDRADAEDKGQYNLLFQIPLPYTVTGISAGTYTIEVHIGSTVIYHLDGAMSDNPKFTPGDLKNKITYSEDAQDKSYKTETVSLKLVPGTSVKDPAVLFVKLGGKDARYLLNGSSELWHVGEPVLADLHLDDTTSSDFLGDATVRFTFLGTGAGAWGSSAAGPMSYAGATKVKEVTDNEIGTRLKLNIGIVGASPP